MEILDCVMREQNFMNVVNKGHLKVIVEDFYIEENVWD